MQNNMCFLESTISHSASHSYAQICFYAYTDKIQDEQSNKMLLVSKVCTWAMKLMSVSQKASCILQPLSKHLHTNWMCSGSVDSLQRELEPGKPHVTELPVQHHCTAAGAQWLTGLHPCVADSTRNHCGLQLVKLSEIVQDVVQRAGGNLWVTHTRLYYASNHIYRDDQRWTLVKTCK